MEGAAAAKSAAHCSSMARVLGILCLCLLAPGCLWSQKQARQQSLRCEELCDRAERARQDGKYLEADNLLETACKSRNLDESARMRLAGLMWESGRHDAAIEEYKRLCLENAGDAKPVIRLTECLLQEGRLDDARLAADSALLRDAQSIEARMLIGKILEKEKDYDAAAETYRTVLDQSPDHVEAQLAIGRLHLARGLPDRACPVFRTILQNPYATVANRKEAEWQLGLAYAAHNRWEDAEDVLGQAIQSRTPTADEWCKLAEIQLQAGHQIQALDSLHHSLQLQPEHDVARNLAQLLNPEFDSGKILQTGQQSPGIASRTGDRSGFPPVLQ